MRPGIRFTRGHSGHLGTPLTRADAMEKIRDLIPQESPGRSGVIEPQDSSAERSTERICPECGEEVLAPPIHERSWWSGLTRESSPVGEHDRPNRAFDVCRHPVQP